MYEIAGMKTQSQDLLKSRLNVQGSQSHGLILPSLHYKLSPQIFHS